MNITAREKLRKLTYQIASALRTEIFKSWGKSDLRNIIGTAASGDYTFKIDEIAEQHLEIFFRKNKIPIAFFSEDKGLVSFHNDPEFLFIVDPIDGTRAAIAGLESCCVSVAAAPFSKNAKLSDISAATLIEIKSGAVLTGVISEPPKYFSPKGAKIIFKPSEKETLKGLLWGFETAGRPSEKIFPIISNLIDMTSLSGGCFILNSASFALSRVCLGQLDVYLDIWGAVVKKDKTEFNKAKKIFNGKAGYLHAYDIAAAIPLAKSTGCIVSDINGNSLDDWVLMTEKNEMERSCLCSANTKLHKEILKYFKNKF